MTEAPAVQLCPQVQRAGAAWLSGQFTRSLEELKKAPYDAAVSKPVLHNKALLAHLLPNLKGSKNANSAHGSASKLHAALLEVLPLHLATPPVADAADSDQAVTSQSVPAQVNLATSLLVNGQALKALKLIAPICRAAYGLPDGVAIKAFCIAVEAQVQIGALQEASETLDAFQSMYFLPAADDPATRSLLISSQEAVALAKKGCPSDSSSARRTTLTAASNECSNTVSKCPVPRCSAPVNDRSVLPAGFSTTPAVPNANTNSTSTPTASGDAINNNMNAPGDSQGSATAATAANTSHATHATAAAAAKTSVSGAAKGAQASSSQQNTPSGIQTLTQQDTVAVYAWLRERLALAQCGVHTSSQQDTTDGSNPRFSGSGHLPSSAHLSALPDSLVRSAGRDTYSDGDDSTLKDGFRAVPPPAIVAGVTSSGAAHVHEAHAREKARSKSFAQQDLTDLLQGAMKHMVTKDAMAAAKDMHDAALLTSAGKHATAASKLRNAMALRTSTKPPSTASSHRESHPDAQRESGVPGTALASLHAVQQVPPALPQLLQRFGATMLQLRLPPQAAAAAARCARRALHAGAWAHSGSAVYWHRRGEAALRSISPPSAGSFFNALLILDEEAEACAHLPRTHNHQHSGGSRELAPGVLVDTPSGSDDSASTPAFQNDPQASSSMHGQSAVASPSCKCTPQTHLLTRVVEHRHVALSCICNLCYIHLQRQDPHACITCANGWFRRPLALAPVATETSAGDEEWLQGVWRVLEDSMQHRRCVESAVHLAGYVGEALCMLSDPVAAVKVLAWARTALARRAVTEHEDYTPLHALLAANTAVAQAILKQTPVAARSASEALSLLNERTSNTASGATAPGTRAADDPVQPVWLKGTPLPVPEAFARTKHPVCLSFAQDAHQPGDAATASAKKAVSPVQEVVRAAVKDLEMFRGAALGSECGRNAVEIRRAAWEAQIDCVRDR